MNNAVTRGVDNVLSRSLQSWVASRAAHVYLTKYKDEMEGRSEVRRKGITSGEGLKSNGHQITRKQ